MELAAEGEGRPFKVGRTWICWQAEEGELGGEPEVAQQNADD